jgi:DNA polymerase-3 subunit delta'
VAEAPGWDSIYGQERAIRLLRGAGEDGHPAHAYLFSGPRGVGKYKTAKAFAVFLLMPADHADPGAVARRVEHEVHPDLIMIEPEGKQILIDQVRTLLHELNLKPVEAERKVVIVDDAESMNTAAANALLKTLEEPPGQAVLILVSCEPERLLPTIVSRCHQVRFRPLRPDEIKSYLVREMKQPEKEAEMLTRVSGGIFGKALAYLKDERRLAHWREAVDMARRLGSASVLATMEMAKRIVDMAEEEVKRYRQQADEKLEELKDALDKKAYDRLEKLAKSRQGREAVRERYQIFADIFEGLASWYRDIMIYSLTMDSGDGAGGTSLVNLEYRDEIHEMAHRISIERAMEAVRDCEEACARLALNANALLLTENLMLQLEEISSGAPRHDGG